MPNQGRCTLHLLAYAYTNHKWIICTELEFTNSWPPGQIKHIFPPKQTRLSYTEPRIPSISEGSLLLIPINLSKCPTIYKQEIVPAQTGKSILIFFLATCQTFHSIGPASHSDLSRLMLRKRR